MGRFSLRSLGNVEVLSKIFKFSIPSWLGFIINLSSVFFLTRFFDPKAYGQINTFNASSNFLMGAFFLGLDSGVIRFFYEAEETKQKKSLLMISLVVPLLLILTATIVFAWAKPQAVSEFLFGKYSDKLLVLLSLNTAALVVVRLFLVIFRMESNIKWYCIAYVSMMLALKLPLFLAVFMKQGVYFAIGYSVITMVILGGILIVRNKDQFSLKITQLKDLGSFFKYSIFTWPVPTMLYFNTVITLIIIRDNIGQHAVGIFASVYVFAGVIAVVQSGFSTFWSGYMFKNYETHSGFIKKVHDYVCIGLILLLTSFVAFRDMAFLLLGKQFHDSKSLFAILLLYPILMILSETTCYGVSIAKKSTILFFTTLVSILANIIILLWAPLGATLLNAGVASLASALVFFGTQTYYGQKYYRSVFNLWRTTYTVFCLILIAFVNQFFISSLPVTLCIIGGLLVMTFFVFRENFLELQSKVRLFLN